MLSTCGLLLRVVYRCRLVAHAKMLRKGHFIETVRDKVLLDFLDLLQLLRQVLIWCSEREISLKVQLGLLLDRVSGDHIFHMLSIAL